MLPIPGTGQLIAVKVMLADLSEHNVQAVRRFYKEAQVTAQLRHPNTVRVFDVGQTNEGALYIAMERLHGPTLEDVLRELGAQGTAMPIWRPSWPRKRGRTSTPNPSPSMAVS